MDKAGAVICVRTALGRPIGGAEQLPATATQFGDALAVDWTGSRAYGKELEIAVRTCVMR